MSKPAAPYAEVPFRGSKEGPATVFFCLAMMMTAILLAAPWMNHGLRHRASYTESHKYLVITAICIDLIIALAVAGFVEVYSALGRLIARGNPAAVTLDRLRLTLATFVVSLLISGLMLFLNGATKT